MTTYVVLEFPDDDHARTLVEDMRKYPDHDLLTPCQEHFVHARLVYAGTTNPVHDECDTRGEDQ